MLTAMRDANQETPAGSLPDPSSRDALAAPPVVPPARLDDRGPEVPPISEPPSLATPDLAARVASGLRFWFALIAGLGVASFLLGQGDVAALAALAGLCVAAQAADIDARWQMLHVLLSWVVPAGGAVMLVMIGLLLAQGGPARPAEMAMIGLCFAAAAASLLVAARPFAQALARAWFHTPEPSRTLRLAARIVFIGLIMAGPLWLAMRIILPSLIDDLGGLLSGTGFGLGLIGYVMVGFAAVGYRVRRDLRESVQRLGLGPLHAGYVAPVLLGVAALIAFNTGAEFLQRRYFAEWWLEDQRINQAIRSGLGLHEMLLLGLSAGIGEEITLRGALQPRLGLFWTSLLFAVLHVQYSWFGIAVIFAIGVILGVIRNRTNTTVAMAIHTLYDIIAVLLIEPPA
jgi:membrane protease YdiL (CAAX protease family)